MCSLCDARYQEYLLWLKNRKIIHDGNLRMFAETGLDPSRLSPPPAQKYFSPVELRDSDERFVAECQDLYPAKDAELVCTVEFGYKVGDVVYPVKLGETLMDAASRARYTRSVEAFSNQFLFSKVNRVKDPQVFVLCVSEERIFPYKDTKALTKRGYVHIRELILSMTYAPNDYEVISKVRSMGIYRQRQQWDLYAMVLDQIVRGVRFNRTKPGASDISKYRRIGAASWSGDLSEDVR